MNDTLPNSPESSIQVEEIEEIDTTDGHDEMTIKEEVLSSDYEIGHKRNSDEIMEDVKLEYIDSSEVKKLKLFLTLF